MLVFSVNPQSSMGLNLVWNTSPLDDGGEMDISINYSQIIVWLIVGALAGSIAGVVVRRTREGFGLFTNLGIGLVGALIGGFIFKALHIDLKLGKITVSLEDLLSAFIGSLIFLGAVWLIKRQWKT
jgi:uncharacterized membrane protein YeaQ/YmgE (transglycosylase-associated protein family)